MSNTFSTTALVLKRRDYQEHDRLFCLYAQDYGKIDVLAKGTKKITSKLNSYLEPFYLIKVMIAKGKFFDKLANCDLIKSYQSLRQDLFGFYLLNYIAEITDGLIVGQTQKNDKFSLLVELLDILDANINFPKDKLFFLVNTYALKLLGLLGYQPEIKRCLHCHKGILLTKNIFDFGQGGIICENCKKVCLIEDYIMVADGVIKLLQSTNDLSFSSLLVQPTLAPDLQQFNAVIIRLITANLEREIISCQIIKNTLD